MKKIIVFVIGLGTALSINLYFRAFPIYFPQLKKQARGIVEQRIYDRSAQEIQDKHPGFSDYAKTELLERLVSGYKRNEKGKAAAEINKEYLGLKDRFQDKSGQTYLMELDGWSWARYTENVFNLGHPGDEVRGSIQIDKLMLAPDGAYLAWSNFLYYLSAFIYRIASFFKPVSLVNFLFYLPLFYMAIFIIVLYLFCFYRWGNLSAVTACLFIGTAPIFLPRSCAGWFDTDILILLLPLLVIWTYLLAYSKNSLKASFFWILFSVFWLGLFAFTWIGWWFILFIIILFEIYSVLNLVCLKLQYQEQNTPLLKKHLFIAISFLLLTFCWVWLLIGSEPLQSVISQFLGALQLNKARLVSIWPNVYSTVGEFKKSDFFQITRMAGGTFLFILALVSMLSLFLLSLRSKRYSDFEKKLLIILIIWFLCMFLACYRGVRFIAFLALPLGVSLGWGFSEIYRYGRKRKKWWALIILAGLILFSGSEFIKNADKSGRHIYPLMTDDWYSLLNTLKDNTPSESIISSWWDFGDWFKAVARRRVVFDGQSQNVPQAYWMSRVLTSNSEEEALAILRMLNNGGNQAFEVIDKYIKDPFKSIVLLNKVILLNSEQGRQALTNFLPGEQVNEVCRLLYAKPPKAYFIVDYTMLGKMPPISYLGNWDFIRFYLTQNVSKKSKDGIMGYLEKLGIDKKNADELYQEAILIPDKNMDNWVSRRFMFYGVLIPGQRKENSILFDNGFIYNPDKQTFYAYSPEDGKYRIPRSLYVQSQDRMLEVVYENNNIDYSALILQDANGYYLVLFSQELAKSLFTRLYFLNGAGLKHFKLFTDEMDNSGRIACFEIKWD